MGIYDREYIRTGRSAPKGVPSPRRWSVNMWLIIINVAVFLVDGGFGFFGLGMRVDLGEAYFRQATQEQIERAVPARIAPNSDELVQRRSQTFPGRADAHPLIDPQDRVMVGERRFTIMSPLQALFHFSTGKLFWELEIWRIVGFQFLHAGLIHLLFNMIGLYFFGSLVEGWLGAKRYLAFYLVCGIFGAIAYLFLNLVGGALGAMTAAPPRIPGLLFNDVYTPLVGASAGVFGVLMASAFIAPNATLLVFGILPIRLATGAYLFVGLALLNLLLGGSNAGGDAAHLGGAAAGAYFIRHTHLLRDFFDVLKPPKRSEEGPRRRARTPRSAPGEAELDRVLAKVHKKGLQSLTDAERRTLRRSTEARQR